MSKMFRRPTVCKQCILYTVCCIFDKILSKDFGSNYHRNPYALTVLEWTVVGRGPCCASQEEDVRMAMAERASAAQFGGEDLPDYQEAGETAAGDFDIRPSTSRSGEGTPMSDEPREDTGEAGAVEDYQQAESISIGDEADDVVDEDEDEDNDVILVEVDTVSKMILTRYRYCTVKL